MISISLHLRGWYRLFAIGSQAIGLTPSRRGTRVRAVRMRRNDARSIVNAPSC